MLDALHRPTCHAKASRISYQLARALARYFTALKPSLSEIYTLILKSIPDFGQQCIVCGSGKTHLKRSTVCDIVECSNVFRKADYNILLADIKQDPEVVDLLLTMVHSAASANNAALVPGCPVSDTTRVLRLLAWLPGEFLLYVCFESHMRLQQTARRRYCPCRSLARILDIS